MGWTSYNTSKEALIAEQLADFNENGYKLLKSRLIGGSLWVVYEHNKLNDAGEKVIKIELILIKSFGNGEWGYKQISDDCGPEYFNCPPAFLAMSNNMSQYAVAWRGACAQFAEKRARQAKAPLYAIGTKFISINQELTTVVSYMQGKQYKYIGRTASGKMYKYKHDDIEIGISRMNPVAVVEG